MNPARVRVRGRPNYPAPTLLCSICMTPFDKKARYWYQFNAVYGHCVVCGAGRRVELELSSTGGLDQNQEKVKKAKP